MLNAVDISNWSGVITQRQVRDWKAAGVKLLICGTQRDLISQQQLNTAAAEDLSTEAYVYLFWAYDTAHRVRLALNVVRGHPVKRLWIDCEDTVQVFGEAEFRIAYLEAKIQDALDACGDMPRGIYTGRWWWAPMMAGSRRFVNELLWYSHYDGEANLNDWYTGFAFGGWKHPTGKQYQGTTEFCGVNVDLNYFPGEEKEMVLTWEELCKMWRVERERVRQEHRRAEALEQIRLREIRQYVASGKGETLPPDLE